MAAVDAMEGREDAGARREDARDPGQERRADAVEMEDVIAFADGVDRRDQRVRDRVEVLGLERGEHDRTHALGLEDLSRAAGIPGPSIHGDVETALHQARGELFDMPLDASRLGRDAFRSKNGDFHNRQFYPKKAKLSRPKSRMLG